MSYPARFDLADLPVDHPLRNTLMKELKVFYRTVGTKNWNEVFDSFTIAKNNTYNELGDVWLRDKEWVVEDEDWDEDRIDRIGQNGNEGDHYV
jgi:hypothetical protein